MTIIGRKESPLVGLGGEETGVFALAHLPEKRADANSPSAQAKTANLKTHDQVQRKWNAVTTTTVPWIQATCHIDAVTRQPSKH